MISKIKIRDFTAEKKCEIEFGPHVTTLTGPSFTGKSTILRAIRFACMNKPSGDKMISWGADKTTVRLYIDDQRIIRRKGKGINSYKLDKEEFRAFGNNVPQPIADLVNMDDLNFQGQHDKPFWFCETAGEVSRQLNSIVNLEVIDRTLSNIDGGIRDANAEIKLTKKRLEDAEEQQKELAFVISLDAELSHVEELEKESRQKAVELARMAEIVKEGSRYRGDRKKARRLAVGGDTALEAGLEWRKIRGKAESLGILLKSASQETRMIDACPPDINLLDTLKTKWNCWRVEIDGLESMIKDITNHEEELWKRKNEAETASENLNKVTKGRCPLCLKPMKK